MSLIKKEEKALSDAPELRIHSDEAWEIASQFSWALASSTRDLAAQIDVALEKARAPAWRDIATAPRGGGADDVTSPKWVDPPDILLLFPDGQLLVCHWDWYYAEGGRGYEPGIEAWIAPPSGEQAAFHYGNPIKWMPLPQPLKGEMK